MKYKLGETVYHKSNVDLAMAITAINTVGGKDEYTCCYYNEISGKFENATFYEYELMLKEERYN